MMDWRRNIPGLIVLFAVLLFQIIQAAASRAECTKTIRDSASISAESSYYEAIVGSDFLLTCHVCRYKHHSVTVTWYKNNVPIIQSSRIHSVHSHNKRQDQFNLRIRSLAPMDFGNYTCGVLDNTGSQVDGDNMVVDKLPPPPAFYSRTDRVNETSQLLTWTGSSKMPIIHFLMEFRLRPLSGLGEDWVSLVIPFNPNTNVQSYLLRGLTSGTTYEARLRTKTRHGISHYSDTWQFSTWSPWTTSAPVTQVYSRQLARTGSDGGDHGDHGDQAGSKHQWDSHNSFNSFTDSSRSLAKELSSFSSSGKTLEINFYLVMIFTTVIFELMK